MREDSVSEAYLLDAPEGSPDSGDATAGTGHHGTGTFTSCTCMLLLSWMCLLNLQAAGQLFQQTSAKQVFMSQVEATFRHCLSRWSLAVRGWWWLTARSRLSQLQA